MTISAASEGSGSSQIGEVPPSGLSELALSQQGFWLLHQVLPGEPFVIGVQLRLRGRLDTGALRRALDALVARHEPLRSTFHLINGEGRLRVERPEPLPLEALDLRELEGAERARRLDLLLEHARRPYDLDQLPLLRAALVRLAEEEHLLLLVTPHISADGLSCLDILTRDLLALYEGFRRGEDEPLEPPAATYQDFIRWQAEQHTEDAKRRMLEFWRLALAGAPPAIELPADRPRPPVMRADARRSSVLRGGELLPRLRRLATELEASLGDVLFAAFAVLLHRLSGADDVVVGTPLANRPLPEHKGLFGCFMNPVVRRADLRGEPSFRELVARVQAEKRAAYPYRHLALSVLLEALAGDGKRDPSRNAVYQTMFSFIEGASRRHELDELAVEVERVDPRFSLLDLVLHVEADPQGLICIAEYNRALFDEATARRFVDHYLTLLEAAAADVERPVGRLELLSPGERRRILDEWNDTAGPFPDALLIHQLFEARVREAPHAPALLFGDERLTYADLEGRANRLARRLQGLGAAPGVLIGVCIDRSLDVVVAMLAVLKAGAAYVPLDPAYPPERLAFMVEDTAAPLVLTERALVDRLPGEGTRLLVVDDPSERERLEGLPAASPPCAATPDDLAYIIYTSGSTGRPKGVVVRHRPALNVLDWVNRTFEVGPQDRLLFVTSVTFDLSVYDVFGILGAGGSVRIASREDLREPARLVERLDSGEITFWDSAPPALVQLASFFPARSARSRLRLVLLSGDWIPVPLPDQVRRAFPGARVVSLGGATEATIWSNVYPIGEVDPTWPSIPYGRPIRNARYYVLDRYLEPQPVGVPGELFIGGQVLADGYHARPELTAERFVADPFVDDPGARMYRTGDLARFFPDGNMEFLGRLDHQVKVRGFRIELGEIEAALNQHAGVERALCLARADASGDRQLVGYVVPGRDDLDLDEVRGFLLEKLPEYMVPAHLVRLAEIPLTANGKLDRAALPAPQPTGARRYVAPETPTEEAVAAAWAEVLGLERIGRTDDFFALGGHSLLAARVVGRLRERLGVPDLLVRTLFERSVLAAFAAAVDAARGASAEAAAPLDPIPAAGEGPVALAPAQEVFWFQARLEPDSTAYLVPVVLRLGGALDEALLRRALDEVLRRHDALRCRIGVVDGDPVLELLPDPSLELPLVDVTEADDPELEAKARARAAIRRSVDLERGPLARACLVRLGAEDHLLAVAVHHIVFDGWSANLFVWELGRLYAHLRDGAPPPPAPRVAYRDVAAWRRGRLTGERLDALLAWWRERLADLPPPLTIAGERGRPGQGGGRRSAALARRLPERLGRAVHALCREERVTPFMLLLAAFDLLLARWTGREDVVVGSPVAGRDRPEVEDLLGCFVNPVVLRTRVEPELTFRQLLARVREDALGALAHAELPFHTLVARLAPRRDLERNPLFRIFFNYLSPGRERPRVPGLDLTVLPSEDTLHKFDLTLYVHERGGSHLLEFVYDRDLLERERVGELAAQLEHLLVQLTADPARRIGDYGLVTPEAAPLLPDPRAPLDGGRGEPLTAAFHRWVARAPERPAVADRRARWTYADLAARAAAVSARLAEGGVRPGDVVAVYAHRSAALVPALLGVLDAGAAFCVLDPAHPPARLARCLEVARPRALVALEAAGDLPAPLAERARRLPVQLRLPVDPPPATPFASRAADPDALAYVAFTSGTTGVPKAIAGDHRPVSHFVAWQAARFELGPDERFGLLSGLSHDPLLRDVFTPLSIGAQVVVPGPDVRLDPQRLVRWLAREAVSVVHLTPALGQLLGEAPRAGVLDALRLAFFGGDRLRGREVRLVRELAPRVRCVNLYGTTETPQGVAFHEVPGGALADAAGAPIGRGIEDVQLLLLARSGALAGTGELAEVCVRTPYLTRGYLGGGEDAARFVPTPGAATPGDRLYRTGDLGRYGPDGAVELVGRADRQVQVRGYRVEPGEVEGVLLEDPAVARAHVAAEEGGLAAWVAARPGHTPDLAALRERLRQALPLVMVPGRIRVVEAFPLTPSGKVDAARLPRGDEAAPAAAEAGHVEPRTQTEREIVRLWGDLLGQPRVGILDDFFALGGHSLLAVRMLSLLGERLGATLPVALLLRNPTPVALAEALHRQDWVAEESLVVEIRPGQGRPLWLIHPVGGHVVFGHRLAAHLDRARPVSGIQARGLDGRRDPFDDLVAMAGAYVDLVRERQPAGPYLLCGPSFGGRVAYEMASQLLARGEQVAFLGLIDTYAPGYPEHKALPGRVADHVQELRRLSWRGRADYLRRRVGRRVEGRDHDRRLYDLDAPEWEATELVGAVQAVIRANHRAVAGHAVRPFEGRVDLFRATQTPSWPGMSFEDPTNGWRRFARGGVEVHPIACTHQRILDEPAVADTGRALERALARAEREARP